MWMMIGYNDGGDFNLADAHHPLSSRKLRPIMPRPSSATTPSNPPCLGRIYDTGFIALNHHRFAMEEQSKRELSTQTQVVVSSRWNPTPEQLQTLEELYKRGTRTPSADQIQQITAQLRRFGKIEGKNVFYWFQNHKARERQKRRRQHELYCDIEPLNDNTDNIGKKDSGSSMIGFQVEQTKKSATNTNSCTSILPEKTVSIEMATSKGAERTGVECRAAEDDGYLHFDHHADHNLQLQRSRRTLMIMERNDTWQHLINSTITTIGPCSCPVDGSIEPKPHQDYANIFLDSPPRTRNDIQKNGDDWFEECPTLQLFPLRSDNEGHENELQWKDAQIIRSESIDTPYQFFEFLPLKN